MARLAAGPEIYHSCICICRIHEQVNQVSHELIQVGLDSGGQAGHSPIEHAPLQPAKLSFFFFFFHHSHHILFVFLSGVSFSAPAEQLSSSRLVNINHDS